MRRCTTRATQRHDDDRYRLPVPKDGDPSHHRSQGTVRRRVNVIARRYTLAAWSSRCDNLLAGIITLALFFDAIAQTAAHPSPELSRQALRKQDRQVCTAQAVQENVARRNRAEFLRYCMADRQGKRRAATRR